MHGDIAAVEAVKRIREALLERDPGFSAEKAKTDVYDGHRILQLCESLLPVTGTCSSGALAKLPFILYLMENGFAFAGMAMPRGVYPWTRDSTLAILKQTEFELETIDRILLKIVRPDWLVDAELPEQLR